jgi:Predicted membrane protein
MLSAKIPPNDLVSAKINMYWDGLFHAAVWVLTVMGVFLLWRAGQRRDVPWSGRTFLGALSIGWGLFNVIEGTLDHQLLGIHHVFEYTNNKLPWDISYLVFGVVMLLIGSLLIRIGNGDVESRGEAA